MARSDYAHWNEEQDHIWWQEEGRFAGDDMDEERFLDPLFDYGCPCEDGDDTCIFTMEWQEEQVQSLSARVGGGTQTTPGFYYYYRTCEECGCGEGQQTPWPGTTGDDYVVTK